MENEPAESARHEEHILKTIPTRILITHTLFKPLICFAGSIFIESRYTTESLLRI